MVHAGHKPPPAGRDDVASVGNYYRGAHVLWVSRNDCATEEGGLGLIFWRICGGCRAIWRLAGADQAKRGGFHALGRIARQR